MGIWRSGLFVTLTDGARKKIEGGLVTEFVDIVFLFCDFSQFTHTGVSLGKDFTVQFLCNSI